MEQEQILQDDEYAFPYHYVAKFANGKFCHHFVDSWAIHYVSTIEFLLERLRNLGGTSVVDIGCGDGRFTREIATLFPRRRVVGLDYSPRAIALAQAMNYDRNIAFERRDITAGAAPETFDAAVLMEVFEHIPPDAAASFIVGVQKLLKPGGRLLLTVPHTNKPVEYKHFRHFDSATLREALEPYFEIEELTPFERRGYRTTLINKILLNRLFALSNGRLLRSLYAYYKARLFFCSDERHCQRLFVQARAKIVRAA